MKIVIAGTGYVGLVTGVCFAYHGYEVTCVDTDSEKIELLQQGKVPIYEDGLEQLIEEGRQRLCFTAQCKQAYKDCDVLVIGVGTPEKEDGSADLSYVFEVAKTAARQFVRDCVVVVKSTVPVGTNDEVEALMRKECREGIRIDVVSNPEFLSQGTAVHDALHASRIVIGAEEEHAGQVIKSLYERFDAPILMTGRRSAEMIKYASNDFLALKLSYINEIANLCEIVGADIADVAQGMGYDSRIGNSFLRAGIGYGGSCFPKDTKALHWLASSHNYELKTIKAAITVNEAQKLRLIEKAHRYYPSLEGCTVAVLGLAFKPGTDDLREAPSLVNVPALLQEGARVRVWDPVAMERFRNTIKEEEIVYAGNIEEAVSGADCCLILTEWEQVCSLSAAFFKKYMKTPLVLDGRNCYEPEDMSEILYESIGRKRVKYDMEKGAMENEARKN